MKGLIFLLLVTGCSQPIVAESMGCDSFVDGLCVIGEPNLEDISYAVTFLDSMTDEDLPRLFEQLGVVVEWVDDLEHRGYATWADEDEDGHSTKADYRLIYLRTSDLCIEQAYVLAHELLHIYAYHVVDVDPSDNHVHAVDGVFLGPNNMDSVLFAELSDYCTPNQ